MSKPKSPISVVLASVVLCLLTMSTFALSSPVAFAAVSEKASPLINKFSPTIQVSPTTATPGELLAVTGSGFPAGARVGLSTTGKSTTTTADASGNISAHLPAPMQSGSYTVTSFAPGSNSAMATYTVTTLPASPSVTSVSPNRGPTAGGTSVTITGTGFTGATGVSFGPKAASFTFVSDTQITATSPASPFVTPGVGSVDVTVTTPNGTSATSSADRFTYVAAPTITSISPSSGPSAGGTLVTIYGTGFTGATSVSFGPTAATGVTVVSDTQIKATSPAGTAGTTVDVTVTAPGGTSSTSAADHFTYTFPVPTVTGVSPNKVATGSTGSVTITGTGFTSSSTVSFGAAGPGSAPTVNAAGTQITVTYPISSTPQVVDVTVTNPAPGGGTSVTNSADKFTYYLAAGPTVTSISPSNGPSAGGGTVTITGTGFIGASSVSFGGVAVPAGTFAVVSDTQILVTNPGGTVNSTVDVQVTTPGGTSATNANDKFTFFP